MGIAQRAQDVAANLRQGMAGDLAYTNFRDETISAVNRAPQAQQVGTVVVDTGTNSELYAIVINGVTIEYTADSATSTTEVATGLKNAINAEPLVRGQVTATSDTATVTVTANQPGVAFTMTEGANAAKMTTTEAVTAADSADAVEFGRLVVGGEGMTSSQGDQYARICDSVALTAQVDTITVDYAAAEIYSVQLKVEGETYEVNVAADTDDATTATAIRAAINAIMPAATVVCTGATDQVILTAEVDGKAFVTSVGLKSGTIARLALVHTTAPDTSDVNRVALGITVRAPNREASSLSSTTGNYAANDDMKVLKKGFIFVASTETISQNDKVYVETAAGATAGRLYKATSATRILLTGAKWHRDVSTGDLAVLSVSF